MTHPDLDDLFPIRPISSDPELRATLGQWEYCAGQDHLAEVRMRLDRELSSKEMIARLNRAIQDDDEVLRVRAARRIIETGLPNAEQVAFRLLNDPAIRARFEIVKLCSRFDSAFILDKIIELIESDPELDVRGSACWALIGKHPLRVIPVLLNVIEFDHDCRDESPPPSDVAATVLDVFLGTEYTAIHLDNGTSTFRPGGPDIEGLKAHANRVLNDLETPGH